VSLTYEQATDPKFWNELCALDASATTAGCLGDVGRWLPELRREGYVTVTDVWNRTPMQTLVHTVETLENHGIPLPFAFVYDGFWKVFENLAPALSEVLGDGYVALPELWVWCIRPEDTAHGWSPHRDRLRSTLLADHSPASLTVWIALTDATPLNGCMYVLPAHCDPCFTQRVWDGANSLAVPHLQDIRALPVTAGSVIAWNQSLLHWGSRASRLGAHSRVSCSMEFQRADWPAIQRPLLDPRERLSFLDRLGLIASALRRYENRSHLDSSLAMVVDRLVDEFHERQSTTGLRW
jgi:hypothetical protein